MSTTSLTALHSLFLQTTSLTSTHAIHLSRVLSTTSGLDSTLCLLSYTLTLLHSQLLRLLAHQYQVLALQLTKTAAPSLLPNETVVATFEAPVTRLSEATTSVKNLGSAISDFRIFLRLKGLLDIYAWGKDSYENPSRDPTIKFLVWAQVGVNACFQFLENGAILASKGVLRGDKWKQREPKWWVWSSRFWLAHVLLEFLRLMRVRGMRYNEELGAQSSSSSDKELTESEKSAVRVQSEELEKRWHRQFYTNAAWFPLTLHWSFEDEAKSPVSEMWVGICGMIAGGYGVRNHWVATAAS